ncbi:MAG: proton-conducting transporter membrane subunit [Myxococcota bacterium]
MTLLAIAGGALLAGALLALVVPGNPARVAVSLLSQAIAAALTVGVAGSVLLTGHTVSASVGWSYPVESVYLEVDPLSAFFLVWSVPMTLLGSLYAWGYLERDLAGTRDAGPHFALLNLLQVSYLVVYTCQDTVGFLLGWEIAAVSAWLLVIWSYRDQKTRFAGFNYLVSTHVGLFLLGAALMVLRAQTGDTRFSAFGAALQAPGDLRTLTFLLLGAAFALKSAFFPGHTWLPRAHAAAPAHISALMSGVIHKAGLFGFLRFTLLLGKPDEWMGWSVLAFGATSAVVGALFTTTQRDLKRLLGYSSTENVGIAAMGFGVGYLGSTWDRPELVALGFGGGLLHVFNHALFKCLLFYAAGAVYRAAHTVDLERLGGLARAMPWTTAAYTVGSLAIAGLPPFNGFTSEFLIYAALLGAGRTGIAGASLVGFGAVLAFVGALSAFAVMRSLGIGFLGTAREPREGLADPGWAMRLPMAAHAVGIAAVGVAPPIAVCLVGPPLAAWGAVAPASEALFRIWPAVGALAIGLCAAAGAAWAVGRRAPVHVTWACGYTAGTPRMQYTASSFSATVADWFASLMPPVVTRHLPEGLFPSSGGSYRSNHADPVEQRLFESLGRGEELVTSVFGRFATEPRVVFGLGLVGLLVGMAVVIGSAK